MQRYADIGRDVVSRLGPLAAVLLAAGPSGHSDIADLTDSLAREPLGGATAFTNRLVALGVPAPGLGANDARDMVWTHFTRDMRMLVLKRGWTDTSHERWLARSLTSALPSGQ